MASFYAVLFVSSVSWLFLLGCQYHCKWLTGNIWGFLNRCLLASTINQNT